MWSWVNANAAWVDGTIIVLYFCAITIIGLRMGRREGSLHEFALGGRRVPWWAVMASIIAAETSAATFLGAPGEGYSKLSLAYVQLIIGLIIGRLIVGYGFLGPYYRYNVYTVYDYLGIRFGPRSKAFVSALFLIMRTLASGTRLFVPSLVMVLAWRMLVGGDDVRFSQNAVDSVLPYAVAIVALMIVTALYTAIGGIKAVIWTDVVQATLMFVAAIVSIGTLLYHIGGDSPNLLNGFRALADAVPAMTRVDGYFLTGFESHAVNEWKTTHGLTSMGVLDYVRLIFASDYTLLSAIVASTALNMASFGTDQDMVQRMLTAQTAAKARRSLITAAIMDIPIATAFTFIGILLWVYYQQDPTFKPAANSDVFGSYILNVMPPVVRGFVLAGVFATAMGSLSAALNALATSATNDWYLKYRQDGANDVRAARLFTLLFAVLLVGIAVGFAFAKVRDPGVRIIPVVLGIAGFILGPMLGVFLLGLFTRQRGSDRGNVIAITVGLLTTIVLGGLHADALRLLGILSGSESLLAAADRSAAWVPKVSFTWFAFIGATVVVAVGVWFRTPARVLIAASHAEAQARAGDDRPLAMRDDARVPSGRD